MSLTDLDRFRAACAYPGELDEQAVEQELAAFLRALGLRWRVVRLRAGWRPEDDPPLNGNFEWILDESVKRNLGVRTVLAPSRAVLAFRSARRRRATHDDDADFASAVRSHRVGRAALEALAARGASDAGAAHAAPAARAGAFVAVYIVAALLVAFVVFVFAALATVFLVALVAGALATGGLAFLAGAGIAVLIARAGLRTARAFAAFVADPGTYWGPRWDLSWTVCALFDAAERGKAAVEARLRPLFEAFVCGCWLIYLADDTLYWVAKPTVHRELGTQRLHHDTRAAIQSDIVSLYFWHGVTVPPFVIARPDLITIAHIDQEENAEVRRAMIERYRHGEEIHGAAAFIRDAGGVRLDHDERYGTLWRRDIPARDVEERHIPGDEPIVMIEVVNRTREPDGSFRRYWLRVPPTMRTAREAVAWTFDMRSRQYAPEIET